MKKIGISNAKKVEVYLDSGLFDSFSAELKRTREARRLSLQALAEAADVSVGNLCAWAYSGKPIGQISARKLAKALSLTGDDKRRFLQAAMMTEKRHENEAKSVLGEAVLKALNVCLATRKKSIHTIQSTGKGTPDLLLTTTDGAMFPIEIKPNAETLSVQITLIVDHNPIRLQRILQNKERHDEWRCR